MRSMIGNNPFSPGLVLLEDRVAERTSVYRQDSVEACEGGGILLGFRKDPHLHVTHVTEPFSTDRRTRISFRRESHGHAHAALRHWQSSGHTGDYLGEWHTHPELSPSPSRKDLREWQVLLRDQGRPLLFLIVGIRTSWLGLGNGRTIEQIQWSDTD